MSKLLIVGVILFIAIGCSDRQDEIEPKKVKEVDINRTKIEDNTTIKNNKKQVDINRTKKDIVRIKEEFVPEHIRKSHIEVVEHY